MPATAPDFLPRRTADGSFTLRSEQIDEHYHSVVGAVNESTHVYIKSGLDAWINLQGKTHVDVLEIGSGTGLNLLLTWIRCCEGKCTVSYTALEPYPVTREQLEALDHCAELAWPALQDPFLERMTLDQNGWWERSGGLDFRKFATTAQEYEESNAFDVIYFDAFGPNTQPEMWTLEVFQRMHNALRPGGLLVTYCAKGEVRRIMQAAGFAVERIQGPPGKREMLRATKSDGRPLSRKNVMQIQEGVTMTVQPSTT